MAAIKVLAGDFSKIGSNRYTFGQLHLVPLTSKWGAGDFYNPKTDIKELEIANERSGVKIFGAAGWGSMGALIAGPVGFLAGALLGVAAIRS